MSEFSDELVPSEPTEEVKRGNRSWRPATNLVTYDKDPDYVYRFCHDEPSNIDKKLQEQWEFVNRTTDPNVTTDASEEHVTGGKKYRELVLMRMHKDVKKERDKHYQSETDQQERGIKDFLQKDMSKDGEAQVHGSVIIE